MKPNFTDCSVTALGELLIDFTDIGKDESGYPAMQAHPGGAPANFLAALAAHGIHTALLGKTGDDAFGHLLADTMRRAGIDTAGLLADSSVFTTLAFVTLDEKGERTFSFARRPGADTCLRPEELNLGLIDRCSVFHFGTLSLTDEPAASATRAAVSYAAEGGKRISFDPNLREPLWRDLAEAKRQMDWGLRKADYAKLSAEEAYFLLGTGPEESLPILIKEYGLKLAFVTCGEDGAWFANGQSCGHVPALNGIQITDTTGAGDIFFGSALAKLLQTGRKPEDMTEAELRTITAYACAFAGLSAARPGGISSVPSPKEAEQWIKI